MNSSCLLSHRRPDVLEFFVHLDPDDPPNLVAIGAEISDDVGIERVGRTALPADWRVTPAPAALADLGMAWVRKRASAVLAVPSVIVPSETNYLLNPAHPHFARIWIGKPEPFSLDPRMRRRK